MDEQRCNQVCTATRTSGFTGIAYSPEELKELQKKDSDLQLILPYLQTNEVPGEDIIFISSNVAKKYWVNKEMFFIDAVEYCATTQRRVENQDQWCQRP